MPLRIPFTHARTCQYSLPCITRLPNNWPVIGTHLATAWLVSFSTKSTVPYEPRARCGSVPLTIAKPDSLFLRRWVGDQLGFLFFSRKSQPAKIKRSHVSMNPPPPPPLDRLSSTVHEAPTDDRLLNGIIRRASFMNSQEPHDPPFVDDTNKLSPHSCVSHNAELYLPANQRPFDPAPAMRSTINASICSNQVHDHVQILFIPFLLILEAQKLMGVLSLLRVLRLSDVFNWMLLQNPEILAEERTSEENSRFMDANIHQRFLYYPQNNTKKNNIISCI